MIKEFQGEYRWLSNMWPVCIEYKGRKFYNVENAFHSEKSGDGSFKDFCAHEVEGRIVKEKQYEMIKLRPDWDLIKFDILLELTRIKFSQIELQRKLLATGDEYLQEGNDWGDTFWGVDNETGEGQNIFGKILMTVRQELRNDEK